MELVKQTRENNAYLAGYSCHDSFSVCYIFIYLFFFVSLFSLLILDFFSRKQVVRLRICAIEVVATPPFKTTTIPQTLNKPVSVDVLWHYFCCRHPASVVPKYKIGVLL